VTAVTTNTTAVDHTLYAQWAWITYAVTYDANGGSGTASPASQTKTNSFALTLATKGSMTKAYNTFSNWNTAANGTGTAYAEGASYTAEAAVTLYAQWTEVVYESAGAIGGQAGYTSGVYYVHVFTKLGESTFTVKPGVKIAVEYLVVAGGGAGGGSTATYGQDSWRRGGGGGAGGLLTNLGQTNPLAIKGRVGEIFTVGVGVGGAQYLAYDPPYTEGIRKGTNSYFRQNGGFDYTAEGGGGGASYIFAGGSGGSGGGGCSGRVPGSAGNSGPPEQGKAGGNGDDGNYGGGGGGAGSQGSNAAANSGGNGGQGRYFGDYLGTGVGAAGYFAGGGGGIGGAGQHGGGNGGTGGTDGTGGGGGGSDQYGAGGVGGNGIVIIRYTIIPPAGTVILLR
jgi:hypothetical protein